MTRHSTAAVILVALGSLQVASCAGGSAPTADVAEHLWQLEDAYIQAHVDADHQAILSVWDDQFLGWPDRLQAPSGKDGGPAYLAEFFATPRQVTPRIERLGSRVAGNVAVLFYRVHWTGSDDSGAATTTTSRLTHTWIQRGTEWRILGGMSSPEPSGADQRD